MILSNSGKFSLLLFSSFSTILSVVCLITAAPLTQFNHLRDSLRLNMVIQDGTEEALGTAGPQWDPIQQIYIGGVVPENAEVQTLIHTKGQWLLAPFRIWLALLESRDRSTFRIWRPEQFGSCSGVQAMLGPKKSTDHRGWPAFPGIVCTLLEDEEVAAIHICSDSSKPMQLFAGGGHSGLLTEGGRLYLWGWNIDGQCGPDIDINEESPLPMIQSLSDLNPIDTAALGFTVSHTLVIEKATCVVFAFGRNERGQVTGTASSSGSTPMAYSSIVTIEDS